MGNKEAFVKFFIQAGNDIKIYNLLCCCLTAIISFITFAFLLPYAVVVCPILDDPLNGNVQFDVSRVPTTMAVYMCDTGFDRNGVLLRRCQQNGMWTQVPPVCDRM